MKKLLLLLSLFLLTCSDNIFNPPQTEDNQVYRSSIYDITLQSMFDASESKNEYDKYVVI